MLPLVGPLLDGRFLLAQVEDAVVMYDHDNKRPRGFGFITFSTEEAVDGVFSGGTMQTLHDKPIEIKRAVPRDQMGPQTRGAVGGRGSYLASATRSVGSSRPLGFSFPGAAGFSPTGLSGRGYMGLGLGGLNGGMSAQDFSRASSDILTQMLAGGPGLANLAQSISQGLAAQGLGNGGSLGGQPLGLQQHNLMLGNHGQAQQQSLGNSALSAQMGRMGLGNGFQLGQQQRSSAPAASPTSGSLRQSSLEDAFPGAFSLAPSMPEQQQQPRQHLQSPGQLQSPQHLQSPGHGSAFANPAFNQGYRDEGAGLGTSAVSALSRDLSGAFSGSFTPHKESSMAAPEHQWSMSSV